MLCGADQSEWLDRGVLLFACGCVGGWSVMAGAANVRFLHENEEDWAGQRDADSASRDEREELAAPA